jgi:hypothetical protein
MAGKALFIHVPELDSENTAQKLSSGLATILRQIIAQLFNNNNNNNNNQKS